VLALCGSAVPRQRAGCGGEPRPDCVAGKCRLARRRWEGGGEGGSRRVVSTAAGSTGHDVSTASVPHLRARRRHPTANRCWQRYLREPLPCAAIGRDRAAQSRATRRPGEAGGYPRSTPARGSEARPGQEALLDQMRDPREGSPRGNKPGVPGFSAATPPRSGRECSGSIRPGRRQNRQLAGTPGGVLVP
jgi:hypothetical protein